MNNEQILSVDLPDNAKDTFLLVSSFLFIIEWIIIRGKRTVFIKRSEMNMAVPITMLSFHAKLYK